MDDLSLAWCYGCLLDNGLEKPKRRINKMSQNRFTSLFVVLFIIKTQFKRIDKIGLFDYVEHKYGESMMRSVKNDLKASKYSFRYGKQNPPG